MVSERDRINAAGRFVAVNIDNRGSMGNVKDMQCVCPAELVVVNDDDVVCVACGTLSPRWVHPDRPVRDAVVVRPRFTVEVLREAYRNTVGWVDPA